MEFDERQPGLAVPLLFGGPAVAQPIQLSNANMERVSAGKTMTRFSRASTMSCLVALSLAFSHLAFAADAPRPTMLSDVQLDKIAAGSEAKVRGDASAEGDTARTGATAATQVGGAGLIGLAAGSATASATGESAVASSTLFLSLTIR
jgi:hypothetical protein